MNLLQGHASTRYNRWGTGASFEEGLKQGGQSALMGAGIGVMTGTVAGVKYAHDNKLNPWTGEETHQRHSDPKFLGGDQNQKTTTIKASRHRNLHNELNDHLRNQTDDLGNHMRPQRGNSGEVIRSHFDRSVRIDATKQFYDSHPIKYGDARYDFYKNNHIKWTPW